MAVCDSSSSDSIQLRDNNIISLQITGRLYTSEDSTSTNYITNLLFLSWSSLWWFIFVQIWNIFFNMAGYNWYLICWKVPSLIAVMNFIMSESVGIFYCSKYHLFHLVKPNSYSRLAVIGWLQLSYDHDHDGHKLPFLETSLVFKPF